MNNFNIPILGDFVFLVGKKEWGKGQVQSVVGNKVTVNFVEAGKQVIDVSFAELVAVSLDNDVH